MSAEQTEPVRPAVPARSAAGPGNSSAPRTHTVAAVVPAPRVPLRFLIAAAPGLVACGSVLIWASGPGVTDPTLDPVVAAAHFGLLAALSMGVLGALHHLTPIVTHRSVRSASLSYATFLTWLGASWLLPIGFASGHENVVEIGGTFAAAAVTLVVVNLWPALSVRGKGTPVVGLRLAVGGLVVTASYGVVYVANRRYGWFGLTGHVVLAHAVVGLFGWLGLTYLTLAGMLWPMFFLANVRSRNKLSAMAIYGVAAGVVLLSPGLLLRAAWLGWPGAVLLAGGLTAHLVMLAAYLRHRRTQTDLFTLFVLTSAGWLVVAAGLALTADLAHARRADLAAATVTAVAGWLLEALVGHALKLVNLIVWPGLADHRAAGTRPAGKGRPGMHIRSLANLAYGTLTAGIAAIAAGFAAAQQIPVAVGGGLLVLTAVAVATSLSVKPLKLILHPEPGSAVALSRSASPQ